MCMLFINISSGVIGCGKVFIDESPTRMIDIHRLPCASHESLVTLTTSLVEPPAK